MVKNDIDWYFSRNLNVNTQAVDLSMLTKVYKDKGIYF